jgi:putative colanic acid biosynthesis glycosyltransferase
MTPILSIITASFNDRDRLSKTIKSLERFYSDDRFEHIIIDGFSSDESQIELSKLKDHNNVRVQVSTDRGIYDAMNKGILLSKGQYLLFLNCGDLLLASSGYIIDSLMDLPANSIEIICFNAIESDGKENKLLSPVLGRLHKLPTSHQAMVFSKHFLEENKYNLNYQIAADYDLYLRAQTSCICAARKDEIFVEIEAEGVASKNPSISYSEYFSIARKNLKGITRLTTLFKILSRGLLVIGYKNFFLPAVSYLKK